MLCWDVKKGDLLSTWRDQDCKAQVSVIARSVTDPDIFAVGYSDGSIRLWDSRLANVILSFNGHKSGVSHLTFDRTGTRLASGSRDTDIIVWDLVGETGLFKLRGHKEQITGLHFIQPSSDGASPEDVGPGFLLSTSKDAIIKLWDVASQYCLETHVTQSNGECWALGISPDESGCITAGNDGELKFWTLDAAGLQKHSSSLENGHGASFLTARGTIQRQGKDRTIGVTFHPSSEYIAVHGAEKVSEIWRVRGAEELKKHMARKRRRRREKEADQDGDSRMEEDEEPAINDVFVLYVNVKTGGKLRSIDWASTRSSKTLQLLTATTNNQIETYSIPAYKSSKKSKAAPQDPDYQRALAVDLPGHRTDVRAICLSSDDRMLATASNGQLKVWNVRTSACLRTLECGYALCCTFLPGDKIVLVGTKSGEIEMFDIAASTLVDTVKAHEGAIWSMKVHPDGKSVVTGAADKTANFWRFDVVQDEIPGTRRTTSRLKLTQTRMLKMNDDVLSLCFTPDGKLLAVSTLDNTVKVFFVDTLKLYLNLYGHKLPVLHMSIANDSKLLATCSADKNIRLWGLDFGDCHKALFAHDDSIMAVSFIADPVEKQDAHTLFSAGKDGLVKTWDADRFQQLQKLTGHHGEVWALAVSRTGDIAVSASHDRSIRVWTVSDEPLFLEEEREKELEDMHDAHVAENLRKDAADADALAAQRNGDNDDPVTGVSKQTGTTLTASEKIMDALTLAHEDLLATREFAVARAANPGAPIPAPQRHPVLSFNNTSPAQHLHAALASVPASALQDALLLLPFSALPPLFDLLADMLSSRGGGAPLAARVLLFLLRTHHKQVVASRELRPLLQRAGAVMRDTLSEWKGTLGWNLAACRMLGERIAEERVAHMYDLEEVEAEQKRAREGTKKRGFVSVA